MKSSSWLKFVAFGMALAFVITAVPAFAQVPIVSCQTATLPERDDKGTVTTADDVDTFVVFNWYVYADAVLHQITVDTHPTHEAGLCTTFTAGTPDASNGTGASDGDPDDCDDTSVDLDELRIGDSNYRPGGGDQEADDSLAIRPIFGDGWTEWEDGDIPVQRATNIALVLSNDEDVNPIKVKVCAAISTTRNPRATVTTEK